MENTKSLVRNAVTGLALIVGMPSATLLPSCTQSQTESKLIYGVSIESKDLLRNVYVVDNQGNVVYNLMKNSVQLTELRKETHVRGGKVGDIVYDNFTTEYRLRLPQPVNTKNNFSVISESVSGKTQKKKLESKKIKLD